MSDLVTTVRVKPWAQSQGEFVEINATDFDAVVHEIYDESAPVPVVADEAQPEPAQKPKRGRK